MSNDDRFPEQERRPITSLFADLQGYTAACERNDPEVVDGVVRRLFSRMEHDVVEAGGLMAGRAGDGFIVMFGTPIAAEDDATRAVECALQLRAIASDAQAEMTELLGMLLPMRIGLNTGPAVVDRPVDPGTSEISITGDSVNVASRLESLAPAGSILVSASTKRLAGQDSDGVLRPDISSRTGRSQSPHLRYWESPSRHPRFRDRLAPWSVALLS